jgi:hypothetical protein
VGRYSSGDSGGCVACEAGRYVGSDAASDCIDCAAGKYVAAAGSDAASDCIDCAAGRYQPSAGQGACDSCDDLVSADHTACDPRWWLGALGQTCDTVCAAAGHACADGDWGVGDRASLEAALAEAGQSSGDRASLCSGGYHGNTWDGRPAIYTAPSRCISQTGATTSCSASSSTERRLCRCA